MRERRKPTKQQEQQRTQDDLLTSPKTLELNCGLWLDQRLWFVSRSVVFCSCIEWGVVNAWMVVVEVVGVFIAPNHQFNRWAGCCRWAHRTVRCTTGYCPMRQPRHPTVRVLTVPTVGALSLCGTWKSPRGGVNRANLKFMNSSTTTSRVSVRNINESEREGEKQIASK
jgi:hypothetical protein